MDLLDYFAAKAMQGLLQCGGYDKREHLAADAWDQAAAMIAEREKRSNAQTEP